MSVTRALLRARHLTWQGPGR